MGMLEDVRSLLILQDRDRRLLAIAKDLGKIPKDEERARARLASDEAALKAAHEAVVECDIRIKKVDLDAQTRKASVARLKVQQFETRKNEEFTAFSHEITRYEKEVDDLETRELELLEEMDGHRANQKAAEAALAKTKGFIDEDLATIAERKSRLEAEREEVSAARADALAKAPADSVPLYERLMKTKDGLAITALSDGKCSGCHMKVIPSTVVKVNAAKEIAQCENCGRILYAE